MPLSAYLADDAALRRDAAFCGIDSGNTALILKSAAEILRRPELLARLEAIDEALQRSDDVWDTAPWRGFPCRESLADAFLLLFPILRRVELARAFYVARGIPQVRLRELMTDVPRWIDTYRERTGGLSGFAEVAWLRQHVTGRIFQIGRLQFQPSRWHLPYTLMKNRKSGECVLLCQARKWPGLKLLETESEAGILAHRVEADCEVSLSPWYFDFSEWIKIAGDGEAILNIHIPGGSPLSPELCVSSIREAVPFFVRYFPENPRPVALLCSSWLLYRRFSQILPTGSNIVAFQRLFRLFPLPDASDAQFYERVFPFHGRAVRREHLQTSLQKALYEHISAGFTPCEDGGFILC